MQHYEKGTANHPRLATDVLYADYRNNFQYTGFVDDAIHYIESFQLMNRTLWKRFVTQFVQHTDVENGWRGEYWGKMMRGAALTYSYTKSEELYRILSETVQDMIDAEDETGRISSYPLNKELNAWDLWCRKYVLLGMQYFLEICHDQDLTMRIVHSMCRQVDYLMTKLGDIGEKKIPITKASGTWRGLNSSSILEPVVRLYNITGEKKYFDFATHIVNCGGTSVSNIFELAYQDQLLPYQYPVTKAYEMTSCFEGLLEYYRITGIEKYKIAVINFANRILESDFTVIGSAGCTHELFDHSLVRQANTTNGAIQQETCVTVTLMKFFYQMTLITGDSKYVDAFEISMYNAYFGSINTEKIDEKAALLKKNAACVVEPLPFDSYSPLTADFRGHNGHIGGLKFMPDQHYYGCCACIGAAGNGLIPKMHLLLGKDRLAMNLYINGTIDTFTPNRQPLTICTAAEYPKNGEIKVTLKNLAEERFTLALRNPAWSHSTTVSVNGVPTQVCDNYILIDRVWTEGDTITIHLDMRTQAVRPCTYGTDILMNTVVWSEDYIIPTFDREDPLAKHHVALRRGPIMLAQENRLGYCVDDPIEVTIDTDGYVDVVLTSQKAPYPCIVEAFVPLTNGKQMLVTDYASAGKLWNEESKMAVWMLTK